MEMHVTKADGTSELFKIQKLKDSLRRSGATKEEVVYITQEVSSAMHEGITTEVIYRRAFDLLRKSESSVAARYSLRRALFNLGPTGFPFEDYLARLFSAQGYTTKTRQTLKGRCAEHEIDVAAYSDTHAFVAEAKFHSHPGMKSDLQVALYSFARLHDLQNTKICSADICGIKEFHIVTNTKFTKAAEKYAICSGLKLLSWEYPKGNNLHDLIIKTGLYPITVLQSLSPSQKRFLIEKGVIVCSDVIKKQDALKALHISRSRIESVVSEAQMLAGTLT
jgi:hypothetical protein